MMWAESVGCGCAVGTIPDPGFSTVAARYLPFVAVRVPRELTENDPALLAPAAGLVYLADDEPGIGREPHATDRDCFVYVDAFGAPVSSAAAARIDALAIPPAWEDVWISPDPKGYLQASGQDDAGRKQYRYHEEYRAFADRRKFERLRYFGRAVVLIRKAVEEAVDRPAGDRDRAVAAAVRLIDEHLLRVGNRRSAEHGHFGATTLTVEHIDDSGHVQLDYVAKSGKERSIVVEDDDLAELLVELAEEADNELFWFSDGEDGMHRATAGDVNAFITQHAGEAFSARDFRTWGGSCVAFEARALGEGVLDAVDEAAEELGNTRAVARSSYIHPAILETDSELVQAAWNSSRSSKWLDRSESGLVKLLRDTDVSEDQPAESSTP